MVLYLLSICFLFFLILPGWLNQKFLAGVEFFYFSLEPLFCGFNYSLFNRKNLQNNLNGSMLALTKEYGFSVN